MNPSQNRRRGKNTERAIAKRMGGKRIGILGKDDVQVGPFSIEVKDKKRFAGEKIMLQAERNCPKDKTPLAVVHLTGQSHDKDILMMRMKDAEEWYGWKIADEIL